VKRRSSAFQSELLELTAERAQKSMTLEEEIDARVAAQQKR
jgi:hypothetical protein